MESLSPETLQRWLNEQLPLQLIDVRWPEEHAQFNIGGPLIPYTDILDQADGLPTDRPVVLYCEKGIRSVIAIQRLEQKFPHLQLYNLTGGMKAWRETFPVDPSGVD
ncbi:MAG TPA: rhodanese-like domain-containing protein [Ferruginibacter sp.]|nr:rhodanese-like domain-containing protein [Ferruginibacter sp.]